MNTDLGPLEPLPYPNQMINKWGDYFYPDSPDEATWFATQHEAHPLSPEIFPWPEAITENDHHD